MESHQLLINGNLSLSSWNAAPLAVLPGTNGGPNILQILGIVVDYPVHARSSLCVASTLETHKLHKGGHLCTERRRQRLRRLEWRETGRASKPTHSKTYLHHDRAHQERAGHHHCASSSKCCRLSYTMIVRAAFPQRDLLITIAAGVILKPILLLADTQFVLSPETL